MLSQASFSRTESILGNIIFENSTQFASLAGRAITLEITYPAFACTLYFSAENCVISQKSDAQSDVTIKAALPTLLRLLMTDLQNFEGVEITGEIMLLQKIRLLFQLFKKSPDSLLWPILAEPLNDLLFSPPFLFQKMEQRWRQLGDTLKMNIDQYVHYEAEIVPDLNQVETFIHQVETLRDDTARLEARINRLIKKT